MSTLDVVVILLGIVALGAAVALTLATVRMRRVTAEAELLVEDPQRTPAAFEEDAAAALDELHRTVVRRGPGRRGRSAGRRGPRHRRSGRRRDRRHLPGTDLAGDQDRRPGLGHAAPRRLDPDATIRADSRAAAAGRADWCGVQASPTWFGIGAAAGATDSCGPSSARVARSTRSGPDHRRSSPPTRPAGSPARRRTVAGAPVSDGRSAMRDRRTSSPRPARRPPSGRVGRSLLVVAVAGRRGGPLRSPGAVAGTLHQRR